MAEAEVRLSAVRGGRKLSQEKPAEILSIEQQARRWNDYGIGLLEQAQYGPAAEAFRHAAELDPTDPNPLVSAAIAEMRTERFGLDRRQLQKAADLLGQALQLNPNHARARFYRARVLRSQGKSDEAASELARLSNEYPRDLRISPMTETIT
jgi:cytochrome c-type biogenesis protein CcmH